VSLAPLSVTVARLGVSSSPPAVVMKITAGRMVDVLRTCTLGVDAAQSAVRAPQLRLIREWCSLPVQGGRSVEPDNARYDAGRDRLGGDLHTEVRPTTPAAVGQRRTQRGEGGR
jgi:hypothetical protein